MLLVDHRESELLHVLCRTLVRRSMLAVRYVEHFNALLCHLLEALHCTRHRISLGCCTPLVPEVIAIRIVVADIACFARAVVDDGLITVHHDSERLVALLPVRNGLVDFHVHAVVALIAELTVLGCVLCPCKSHDELLIEVFLLICSLCLRWSCIYGRGTGEQ